MAFKDKDRCHSEEYKEYQRNYQRGWHQRHKAKRLARMYEKKAATYEYVQNIKSQLRCVDCGERHPAALQFHILTQRISSLTLLMQSVMGLAWIGSRKKSVSASSCAPTATLFGTTICEIKSKPAQGSPES